MNLLAQIHRFDRTNNLDALRDIAFAQQRRVEEIRARDHHHTLAGHTRGDEQAKHLRAAAHHGEKLRSLPGSRAARRAAIRALMRHRNTSR